jgi:hypothetical protein
MKIPRLPRRPVINVVELLCERPDTVPRWSIWATQQRSSRFRTSSAM